MMRFSLLRIRLVLFILLAGSVLSGCITSNAPATKFYVLNPLDYDAGFVGKTDRAGSLSVAVTSLRLPQYLERPQIVTRSSENRLELAEYHQWGGNLRKNMMRVLAKNLAQVLASPNIAISPHLPAVPPDFRVEMEVMQFERDPHDQVRLSVRWSLSCGSDRKPLEVQISDLESPAIFAETGFEHTVSAMSMLLGEFSKIIGQAIMENTSRRDGH